jgi:hypothetical protein
MGESVDVIKHLMSSPDRAVNKMREEDIKRIQTVS